MRSRNWACCLSLLLATACGPGQTPKGPVAATVNGEAITVAQLDAELKAADAQNISDPEVRNAALGQIVLRKLMASSARDAKLDKAPEAALLKAAAAETFEASLERRATLAKTPAVTAAEAEAFVQSHPEMFAQRTAYLVDRLQLNGKPDAATGKALGPANTFEDVETVLKSRGVPYRRSVEELDSLRMDPRISAQIARVPAGAPFVLPTPPGLSINRIRASKPQPVTGEAAVTFARQALAAQRRTEALNKRLEALKTAAAGKISYGQGYAAAPN